MIEDFRPGDKVRIKMPKGLKSAQGKARVGKMFKKLIGRVVTIKSVVHPEIYALYTFVEVKALLSGAWLARVL